MDEYYRRLIKRADNATTLQETDVVRLVLQRALRRARNPKSGDNEAVNAMEEAMRVVARKREEYYPQRERWFDRIAAIVLAILEGWGASS